jgi:hypothetical protein
MTRAKTLSIRAPLGTASVLGAIAFGLSLFVMDRTSKGDPPPAFMHPGVVVTQKQLDFVKMKIAAGAEPWTSAFNAAKTFPSDAAGGDPPGKLGYQPHMLDARAKTLLLPAAPAGYVLCGSVSDPDIHCTDEKEDGVAAYTQALLWYLSPDGSDKDTYGQSAINILNAWASLQDHLGYNAGLESGWMGTEFARAAEIMRLNPNWQASDFAAFKAMMRRAFLGRLELVKPGVAQPGDSAYGQNGNWDLSLADSMIQIGVLLDDHDVFKQGVALWRDRAVAYCYLPSDGDHPDVPCSGYAQGGGYAAKSSRVADPYGYFGQAGGNSPGSDVPADAGPEATVPSVFRAPENGTSQETCRDLDHVQYGLAAMMNGAETARIQGVDLYREQAERIVACMENTAGYLNMALGMGEPTDGSGNAPPYPIPLTKPITLPVSSVNPTLCPASNGKATLTLLGTGSLTTFVVEPTWEIGYNEYVKRLGMSMPNTAALVNHYRTTPPAKWIRATHHIAHEMLTHADVGNVGLENVPAVCGGP